MKLDRDVELSSQVGFVCVTKSSQVVPGDSIYAIGWGYTENSRNQGLASFMLCLISTGSSAKIEFDKIF